MQLNNAPSQLTIPFANDGNFNVIPVPSQQGITPGAASWTDGFPPLTMTAVNAGGIPPSGKDMNGFGNALSALLVYLNAGGVFPYNEAFSASVGGYPSGAMVLEASGNGYWRSIVDNNNTDPDTGGAGWVSFGGSLPPLSSIASSVYASAQQTLGVGTSKVLFDTVEFDSGVWDAANKRFLAPFAGLYVVSGAVLLDAPGGQSLTTEIFKNGAALKLCFQAPQVSTGNLSLPFYAIVSCAVGDFVEIFMNIPETAVLAGQAGTNQPFVFAQAQYLGT
jgi:hypothetical protein